VLAAVVEPVRLDRLALADELDRQQPSRTQVLARRVQAFVDRPEGIAAAQVSMKVDFAFERVDHLLRDRVRNVGLISSGKQ
jgi:hypothetical protein